MDSAAPQPHAPFEASPGSKVRWLTRLRWATIVGQTITILVAWRLLGIPLDLAPLFALLAVEVAVNLATLLLLLRGHPFSENQVLALLALDLVVLTGLLHFAGGPSNPFNFLYLVHVVLGAVLLGTRPAAVLIGVSGLLFGALFLPGILLGEASPPQHAPMMRWHLEGMWVAFVIAAVLIVYFLGRIDAERSAQRRALAEARELAARHERLSSLATLAAGAAHELATPLSTIALVSKELTRGLESLRDVSPDLRDDAALLRSEVRRCQEIIERMAVGAAQGRGESPTETTLAEFVVGVLSKLDAAERIDLRVTPAAGETPVCVSREGLSHALRAVLENALDASPPETRVVLRVEAANGRVTMRVDDRGSGIPEELLPRVVEPFFTTKPPGRGMGLGLFLTDNVLRQLDGRFALGPGPGGRGTSAVLEFPARAVGRGVGGRDVGPAGGEGLA